MKLVISKLFRSSVEAKEKLKRQLLQNHKNYDICYQLNKVSVAKEAPLLPNASALLEATSRSKVAFNLQKIPIWEQKN
ncbi:hypothetical protein TNCV_4220431 [Trichonephila clavipes]|nr:hypothetical protein TNCV_4220431 [Trichonephila clavipes]